MWRSCCCSEISQDDHGSVPAVQLIAEDIDAALPGVTGLDSMPIDGKAKRTNSKVKRDSVRLGVAFEKAYQVHCPCGEDDKLGLIFDTSDENVCLVSQVEDGLIANWNLSSPSYAVVKPRHRLLLIDGRLGSSSDLVAELEIQDTPVILTFQEPTVLRIVLKMEAGQELGMQLKAEVQDVRIVGTKGGMIEDWNAVSPGQTKVKASDRIIAANGESSNGKAILEVIESSDTLDLIVLSWSSVGTCESSMLKEFQYS
eukprot:TRINITY_DN6637_c0_g1_i2.p1 TRINITY_DN6637_c0_g1~~TRINITY_DN6637_c0_g1_i2.p1  ORF type:complete len:256 (-),score=60.81 TRINITY_DN6637_c0_g1_i2:127-894(-)